MNALVSIRRSTLRLSRSGGSIFSGNEDMNKVLLGTSVAFLSIKGVGTLETARYFMHSAADCMKQHATVPKKKDQHAAASSFLHRIPTYGGSH